MGPPHTGRLPLDTLVGRLEDRDFVANHRRQLSMRATGPHVNPVMLAASSDASLYVQAWRRHAAACATCRELFVYFGLSAD